MNSGVAVRSEIVVACDPHLHAKWPNPLAGDWRRKYPQLFDDEDLHLTQTQRRNHFGEWFVAVYLYETLGAVSLVEKYLFENHPQKAERLRAILNPAQLSSLRAICKHVQPPDLLVHMPSANRFWFAEVKRPREPVSSKQRASHEMIETSLRTEVLVYRVKELYAG